MVGSLSIPACKRLQPFQDAENEKARHLNGDGVMVEGAACVAPPHLHKIIKLTVAHNKRTKWTFRPFPVEHG